MHRNADRARLIRDGAGDGLPDPPRRVGGKLVALAVIEFFHGLHQPEIALLDQIEEKHTAVDVPLGDADDQTQVRLDKLLLRFLVAERHLIGQFQLLFGGEQRHLADVLEIHPHRVVDGHALLQQHLLHFLGRFVDVVGQQILVRDVEGDGLQIVGDLDAVLLQRFVNLFNLLNRAVGRIDDLHNLRGGDAVFRLPAFDEAVEYFFEILFHCILPFLSCVCKGVYVFILHRRRRRGAFFSAASAGCILLRPPADLRRFVR